jgi:hypothetical protein
MKHRLQVLLRLLKEVVHHVNLNKEFNRYM